MASKGSALLAGPSPFSSPRKEYVRSPELISPSSQKKVNPGLLNMKELQLYAIEKGANRRTVMLSNRDEILSLIGEENGAEDNPDNCPSESADALLIDIERIEISRRESKEDKLLSMRMRSYGTSKK